MLHLGESGAHPDDDDEHLRRDDHVDEVGEEREAQQRGHVLLCSRRQEDDLVAQAHQQDQAAVDQHRPLRQYPGAAFGQPVDGLRRQHQQQNQAGQDQLVEAGVPGRASIPLGERHALGVRRDAQGVVLPPIEDSADGRIEVERQRAAGGRQPGDLEQDGPDHELLVQDRLVPPAADVVELESRSEGAGDDEPEQCVQEDLPRVERAGLFRRPEAMFHPVELEQLHPFEERDLRELVEIDVGQLGCSIPHGGYLFRRTIAACRRCRSRSK